MVQATDEPGINQLNIREFNFKVMELPPLFAHLAGFAQAYGKALREQLIPAPEQQESGIFLNHQPEHLNMLPEPDIRLLDPTSDSCSYLGRNQLQINSLAPNFLSAIFYIKRTFAG